MKISNQTARRYYHTVKKELSLPPKASAEFLAKFQKDLVGYLETNPQPSQRDLVENFGTPQRLVQCYIDEMGLTELAKSIQRRRAVIMRTGAIVLTILIIMTGIWIASLLRTTEIEVTETITIHQEPIESHI